MNSARCPAWHRRAGGVDDGHDVVHVVLQDGSWNALLPGQHGVRVAMVLISPLCRMNRLGCGGIQLGLVLVEAHSRCGGSYASVRRFLDGSAAGLLEGCFAVLGGILFGPRVKNHPQASSRAWARSSFWGRNIIPALVAQAHQPSSSPVVPVWGRATVWLFVRGGVLQSFAAGSAGRSTLWGSPLGSAAPGVLCIRGSVLFMRQGRLSSAGGCPRGYPLVVPVHRRAGTGVRTGHSLSHPFDTPDCALPGAAPSAPRKTKKAPRKGRRCPCGTPLFR